MLSRLGRSCQVDGRRRGSFTCARRFCDRHEHVPERRWSGPVLRCGQPALRHHPRPKAPLLGGVVPSVKARARWARAPREFGQRRLRDGIEPRRLARSVPVVALFDVARATAVSVGLRPPAVPRGPRQPERCPSVGVRGVLEHAAERAYRCERRGEASSVVAERAARLGAWPSEPVPAPPLTRRVRHDRMRARVPPSVARLVPRIDARQPVVRSASVHVEGSDHARIDVAHADPFTRPRRFFLRPPVNAQPARPSHLHEHDDTTRALAG